MNTFTHNCTILQWFGFVYTLGCCSIILSTTNFLDDAALTFENETFSYRTLNTFVSKLANYLKHCGINIGDVVAIRMQNPSHAILMMLACIRVGAPYVYINPTFPVEFQNRLIRDSCAKLTVDVLPSVDSRPRDFDCGNISDDELAYIVYTSGTTGMPKGVGVSRRSLNNYIQHCLSSYFKSAADDVLVHGSLSCDMPITTIFPPLCIGKRIFVLNQDFTEQALIQHKGKFALAKLTPSHIRWMMNFKKFDFANFTDILIIGGEELTESVFDFCKNTMPNTTLINEYGPTESTVGVTVGINSVHIGKPITNTHVYLLDDNLIPVEKGEVGHLYVSGLQLARGYINNPSLTAEKFLANPFFDGERMYDTGDLARELPNGSLMYLGRSDFQMKVNGYRIEPGEIRTKLLEIDILQDVFVTCDKDHFGNDFLVAYYTLIPDAQYGFETAWKTIYENLYADEFSANINNIGWKNSYDGSLFSLNELAEWKDDVVHKMQRLKHCNVFEIGCGTGMIVTSLQKSCNAYVGVDLSESVIKNLTKFCEQQNLENVKLYASDAMHSVSLLENYSPDLVVLNSVIQYFPNVIYLENLLEKILKKLSKETSIFIGDIRDFRLANIFYASVENFFNHSIDEKLLSGQIIFRSQIERELLISPEFFEMLNEKFDDISYVEFLPKFGQSLNELNLFRYDAVLHLKEHVFEEEIPEYECDRELFALLNEKGNLEKFIVRDYEVEQ